MLSAPSGPCPIAARNEAPDRVPAEADRDEHEQELAERLVGDRVKRALLVGDLAAAADREPEREDADDPVDEPARDEARAGEHLEAASGRSAARRRPAACSWLSRLRTPGTLSSVQTVDSSKRQSCSPEVAPARDAAR